MADAVPARTDPGPLSETVRTRIRMRAYGFTHEEIAQRMTRFGRQHVGPDYQVKRAKVSEVIRGNPGDARPQLDDVPIWAMALGTTEAFLLGFTQDWAEQSAIAIVLPSSDTPG